MATLHHFLLVSAVLILFSSMVASGHQGTATFYTKYTPSACNGNGDNGGTMIAAASDELWDGGAACGRRYRVQCTGPTNNGNPHPCKGKASVTVTIVDYCPDCNGTIDLSEEAFSSIADEEAGKIKITYNKA